MCEGYEHIQHIIKACRGLPFRGQLHHLVIQPLGQQLVVVTAHGAHKLGHGEIHIVSVAGIEHYLLGIAFVIAHPETETERLGHDILQNLSILYEATVGAMPAWRMEHCSPCKHSSNSKNKMVLSITRACRAYNIRSMGNSDSNHASMRRHTVTSGSLWCTSGRPSWPSPAQVSFPCSLSTR